jgi:nitrogen fixation protein FixH
LSSLCWGCSKTHAPASVKPDEHIALLVSQTSALKNSTLQLTVTNASNQPVNVGKVTIDLTMTTMLMPPNTVNMREISPGVYVGTGIFTMAGPWQANVKSSLHGKESTIGSFAITVKN